MRERLYGTSTFVGYLTPNPFKQIISSISNNPVKHKYAVYMTKQFYSKQFSLE